MDPEVLEVVFLSLKVSSLSTLLASVLGLPLGFILATKRFTGRQGIISVLNSLLGLPTVVAGLFVYAFLSRQGILGVLGLLFTWQAIVIGQFVVVLPLITALVLNAIKEIEEGYRETALSLGASRWQAALLVLWEARFAISGAIIAGFGRVLGEVGVSMMLGGNIAGSTRTLTTAIALETSKGDFGFALALGLVLLLISFIINTALHWLRER
ncbi:MAG: ABC transporter permease [Firmicutes bacterium]|nr:ABC transporter permease [Bacillota bacterium]